MAHDKHIAILANPLAGGGRALKLLPAIEQFLVSREVPFHTFTDNWPENLIGHTDIWLIGGDGTLNFFVNRYPDVPLPITFFNGGSGNDFHAALYGKSSLSAILNAGLHSMPRPIDAGLCNGRLFMNGMGIGFDGNVAASMRNISKKKGVTGYWMTVIRNVFFYREAACRITCREFSEESPILMVNAMNGQRSGGGFKVTPDAELDDGLFNILVIPRLPVWQRLRYLPAIEKGKHTGLPFLSYFKTEKISISSADPMDAHLDGEYLCSMVFEISVLKGKFLFRH